MSADVKKKIRMHWDNALDVLEARAEAFAEQLTLSEQQAGEQLEKTKRALGDILERLKSELERQKPLAEETRRKLLTAIQELEVQLALGKAEARDALTEQRKKLDEAIKHFETISAPWLEEGKQHFDDVSAVVMQQYERTREVLKAELEAAVVRAREEAAHQGEALEKRRQELLARLSKLRAEIDEKRKHHADKLEQFEKDIKPAIDQVGKAFKELFS